MYILHVVLYFILILFQFIVFINFKILYTTKKSATADFLSNEIDLLYIMLAFNGAKNNPSPNPNNIPRISVLINTY